MKVKEIDRTANIAWSPAAHHPIYIVAGTAAQQLDATFSTTASLELYDLNLTEPGLDTELKGSIVSDYRFHKLVWGSHGMNGSELTSGVIVGGADGGNLFVYDPVKLLQGETSIVCHKNMHTGAVRSLDFNIFQPNLLVSGASESELFVWDLNNPSKPMIPGKSQPPEDVTCVAWNRQVQHILASAFPARCVVWDLRKTEPIIKVSDTTSRIRCKVVAWHPEVATQLCLASEDDHNPVIQLWDLRFATSPLKTLEHHQRGILSIAWCPRDPDLLLSCGKDNTILCWNPNSNTPGSELVCELPTTDQWCFDVAWCPRNPAVIASSSSDGHISIYSLMGGQQQTQPSSKIAESFPGSESFAQPPISQTATRPVPVDLKKPPKWLRRPTGANFSFGGKLVTYALQKVQSGQISSNIVYISNVVTEPILLSRASKLESALTTGNTAEFCQSKLDSVSDPQQKMTWKFLQATFETSPRFKMLSLLGYDPQHISTQITELVKQKSSSDAGNELQDSNITAQISSLDISPTNEFESNAFDAIAAKGKELEDSTFRIHSEEGKDDEDSLLTRALLTGNVKDAVELCIMNEHWADALVLAQAEGKTLLQSTQSRYFRAVRTDSAKLISAIVSTDWEQAVRNCDIDCWKEILAAVLTYAKPESFSKVCENLGARLEVEKQGTLIQSAMLCYICAGNLERLSQCWVKMQGQNPSPVLLQGLVEEIMILRCSVEQLSGQKPVLQSGTLANLLNQYAAFLASQGGLSSAATYLVDTQEPSMSILRDRIYQSLGLQSPQFPFTRVNIRVNVPIQQQQQQQQQQTPVAKPTPQVQTSYPQYSTPQYGTMPIASSHAGYSYPSTTNFQYQPAAPPPPVPLIGSSTGSQPGTPINQTAPPLAPPPLPPPTEQMAQTVHSRGHLSHRYPSHLHDPSVYTEPSYSQPAGYGYAPSSIPQSQPSYIHQQPQPITQSIYHTEYACSPPTYTLASTALHTSAPNTYNSTAMAPQPQMMPPAPPAPAPPPPVPQCSYDETKPGWNDPPPLPSMPKAFSQYDVMQGNYTGILRDTAYSTTSSMHMQIRPASTYQPPAPIISPLIGATAPEPLQPLPTGPTQGNYFVPNYQNPSQPQGVPQIPPPQSPPEPVKEKGPIPPEHQVIQDIFDDLRHQCQQVATNPQIRRKLDELSRKLENLYDKLRENMLSSGIILGLHQIIQSIQQSDYQAALSIHSHVVSSANFSEICTFMPGIKVLLQTAQQLGVYLQ